MLLAHANDHTTLSLMQKLIHFMTGWHGFILLAVLILFILVVNQFQKEIGE